MASTSKQTKEQQTSTQAASEEAQEQQTSTNTAAAKQDGQAVTVIPKSDGVDIDMRTLDKISAIKHSGEDGKNPFAGYTAETLQKITIADKPVYINIVTDPNTGEVISAEMSAEAKEQLAIVGKQIEQAARAISAAVQTEALENLKKNIAITTANIKKFIASLNKFDTKEWHDLIEELIKDFQPKHDLIQEIYELEPLITKELEKPEYNGLTFEQLTDLTPGELFEQATDPNSTIYKVLQAARAASATNITPYKADKLDLPLDKINLNAWGLTETGGQIEFNLARHGTKDMATGLFSLSFVDDPHTKISRQLTQYDKRVSEVIDTGYKQGINVFTLTSIYHNMGNTKRPGQNDFKKINASLDKLGAARVFFDNAAEARLYNYEHTTIKDAALLYFKRIRVVDNGKVTDGAIQVLEEPALMQLARTRQQITTVPEKVLQSGISMTEPHLKIEDYLLQRITQRKHEMDELLIKQRGHYTQKRAHDINELSKLTILLDTFYKYTGNDKKDTTGKKRALETAERYLYHYKSDNADNYIKGYVVNKTKGRIEIMLPIPAASTLN